VTEELEARLRRVVGDDHVLADADLRAGFETDWTGQYHGRARVVVRPATTEQVAGVIRLCGASGVPVVPQGGNTGLVGGSVPDESGAAVVLSTTRLDALDPVDTAARQLTAGAGVTLAAAQSHAGRAGLRVAVDLAARDSATIGGMAATNAGGVHVLRYGTMRRQVAGLEAVLADGSVVSHLAGLEKDNTGYDLTGLLCGSEGTLAVITRVRLRLIPVPAHLVTALLAWPDLATMVDGLNALRARIDGVEAAEYVVRRGVELVTATFGTAPPFAVAHAAYLIVEVAGSTDSTDALAGAIGDLPGVLDVAVATGAGQRHALWQLRELHTEALAHHGPPRKYDVTVPVGALATFVAQAVALVEQDSTLTCHHFGHLGDGNVHLNVLGVAGWSPADLARLDDAVLGLVSAHGGSISAEHGIGRLKRPWLHLSRSQAEIAAMTAIKGALDPSGMLSPGILLPDAGQSPIWTAGTEPILPD
jgi:FAD/FMN-containing dehydrogenase